MEVVLSDGNSSDNLFCSEFWRWDWIILPWSCEIIQLSDKIIWQRLEPCQAGNPAVICMRDCSNKQSADLRGSSGSSDLLGLIKSNLIFWLLHSCTRLSSGLNHNFSPLAAVKFLVTKKEQQHLMALLGPVQSRWMFHGGCLIVSKQTAHTTQHTVLLLLYNLWLLTAPPWRLMWDRNRKKLASSFQKCSLL